MGANLQGWHRYLDGKPFLELFTNHNTCQWKRVAGGQGPLHLRYTAAGRGWCRTERPAESIFMAANAEKCSSHPSLGSIKFSPSEWRFPKHSHAILVEKNWSPHCIPLQKKVYHTVNAGRKSFTCMTFQRRWRSTLSLKMREGQQGLAGERCSSENEWEVMLSPGIAPSLP